MTLYIINYSINDCVSHVVVDISDWYRAVQLEATPRDHVPTGARTAVFAS